MKKRCRQLATALMLFCTLSMDGNAHAAINYLQSLQNWANGCHQLLQHRNKHWNFHASLRSEWATLCHAWTDESPETQTEAKQFFERHFQVRYRIESHTLITGYYAPTIHACWMKQPNCSSPLYALLPQSLRFKSREEINQLNPKYLPVIAWTNPIDRYFLQIQGSGTLVFNSGETLHLRYAGKNKRSYKSIGRFLSQRHQIERKELNMQGIRHYLNSHPKQRQKIMELNPSFVYFKPSRQQQVVGKLGAPLRAKLSAAVDNRVIPLGALILVKTNNPLQKESWQFLLSAHDTGGAIRGAHHIDIYMGQGKTAGKLAGNMHQTGVITYYVPKLNLDDPLPEVIDDELIAAMDDNLDMV